MLINSDYKLLIVDDQPKNIQLLANVLSNAGYQVEYATNGKDAIDWVIAEMFDLILLDVMMPNMDGFETCSKIKELPLKDSIPIIFITAKNDVESVALGFNLGGVDYITKPFNEKELLARVKTHIELKKHKDELENLVNIRTEELQIAYKELETLDAAKGEFLSLLSHEIRTPLNGILGFLEILKRKTEAENIQELLNHLDTSARRLEDFALKALLITSLRAKKYNISRIDVNLNALVQNAIGSLGEDFKDIISKVDITFVGKDIVVHVDVELFLMAFEQIIKNVFVHAPKADEIVVQIEEVGSKIKIVISDNGQGFSEITLKSAFKPFGRTTVDVNKNVGL